MLSSKESYDNKGGFKCFIGYRSNVGSIQLYIKLPQMNAFVKYFDDNYKYKYHLFNDTEVLEKYNAVWDKVNN